MASPVWQYFKVSETDIKIAVCKECEAEIPRGGTQKRKCNTTNLFRHLRVHHLKVYSEYERQASASVKTPSSTQLTVSETFKRQEPYSRDSKKSKEITAKVMEFIGLDQQPLSVVEDNGFRRLITTLDPRYILPGRKYFTDVCLPQLYILIYSTPEHQQERTL